MDKSKKSKAEDRRLMIKKHFSDKQKKKQSSSSKSDSKKSDAKKDASEKDSTEMLPEENSEKRPDSPSRSSPEPNCAICLETLTNKSFTDSCFHTFCFTCLVEWSKVKPECPLCKQQFKSIVHNVQNDFSYDEYHINTRTTNIWTFCTDQRFRYSTTMTAARILERNTVQLQDNYNSQIESHRMRYAPHAVRILSNSNNMSREPCNFRIRVYTQGLWVRPAVGDRVRMVSPEFFRRYPACTHRLIPWLNRELVALLQNNESQVTFVLELIMELIARFEITSQEFYIHIEPYLGDKTRHFIHELYNFAISPHDMEVYDRHTSYSGPTDSQHLDHDNDVRIVNEEIRNLPSPSNSIQRNSQGLKKLILKKNGDSWESVSATSAANLSNPGPSTSTTTHFINGAENSIQLISTIADSEDDECQVLGVLKPRSERTPEVVDLSSDEDVQQTVIDVPSDSDSSCPDLSNVSTPRFEFSPASSSSTQISNFEWRMPRLYPSFKPSPVRFELNSPTSWSSKYPPSPDEYSNNKVADSDSSSSDIQCIYTSEQASTSTANRVPVIVRRKSREKEDPSNKSSSGTKESSGNVPDSNVPEPKKKLSSLIVRPWAMKDEGPRVPSPNIDIPKRPASNDTAPVSSDATSDDPNSSPKKLKLRSVVAHFSFDNGEKRHDSSHRTSHKKHKERKKKRRKKRSHKHKHRVYSDSDST